MRRRPGEVRDAIVQALEGRHSGATVQEITSNVAELIGPVGASSVRSYLRLNTPTLFARTERAQYVLSGFDMARAMPNPARMPAVRFQFGGAALFHDDCLAWLDKQPANTVHAVVTDPPYGLLEYSDNEQGKLRAGKGGVWRIPPSFDGSRRAPLPRFTVLKPNDLEALEQFFLTWTRSLIRVLVPG